MRKATDLTGRHVGRLTVMSSQGQNKHRQYIWLCRCACGNETTLVASRIIRETVKSCGCLHSDWMKAQTHNLRHGHARAGAPRSPTYLSWRSMMGRCTNPNDPAYDRYGGAGISVCARWRNFDSFLADMGERPDGTSIDRFPVASGDYEPGNARWATDLDQNRNSRSCKLTVDRVQELLGRHEHGEPAASIADRFGVTAPTVRGIIRGVTWCDLSRPWLA